MLTCPFPLSRLPGLAADPAANETTDADPENVIRVHFGADPVAARALYDAADRIDEDPARSMEALALYRRSFQLDPSLASAVANMGRLFYIQGDTDLSFKAYRRALAIDPELLGTAYNVGCLLVRTDRPWEAIPYLRRAVFLEPSYADAHLQLAIALEETRQAREAIPHWEAYLRHEDPSEHAWRREARRRLDERGAGTWRWADRSARVAAQGGRS
jgi:tetratricopeptide (TPR) repeat protein